MSQTLGLTGYAGSGKDTAAQGLLDIGWERRAFADPLRDGLLGVNPLVEVTPDQRIELFETIGEVVVAANLALTFRLSFLIDNFGWDACKRIVPEVRRLQQTYGTEGGRYVHGTDCWLKAAHATMILGVNYVFTDCRFPNEVEMIHQMGGCVIRIDRPGVGAVNAHASDDIGGLLVDLIIVNDGTVEELHAQILKLVS